VDDERGVDALGEGQRIRIVTGADDDSGMMQRVGGMD
jgi:hypothetical protein